MHNIILLSSFHIEIGKCNPAELHEIIKEINPDIIFEELSHDTFQQVYKDGIIPKTIEVKAIKEYLRTHFIKHFPVDSYPISESNLFSGVDEISKRSDEYINLLNEQISKIKNEGYSFINSNENIELLDKITKIEKSVLFQLNNKKLSHEFNLEIELHNKREFEMLKNIYNYSKQYKYNKALFICGAYHRKQLKLKIKEYENNEELKLNWAFYDDK